LSIKGANEGIDGKAFPHPKDSNKPPQKYYSGTHVQYICRSYDFPSLIINSWFLVLPLTSGGLDYVEVSERFEFSDISVANFAFNATILDDEIVEDVENFTVVLSVPEEIAQHFLLSSLESLVLVLDDDGNGMM
jgi:hypothetical protein